MTTPKVCFDVRHSRPATNAERDSDTAKRIAALKAHRCTMSAEQYVDRMAELEQGTFVGYPRCTRDAEIERKSNG